MAVDSDFAPRSERMIQHDRAAVAIAGFPVERFAGWNRLARRVDDVRVLAHVLLSAVISALKIDSRHDLRTDDGADPAILRGAFS